MARYVTSTSDKSRKTAYKLWCYGGLLGLHCLYVGRVVRGVLYWIGCAFFLSVLLDLITNYAMGQFKANIPMICISLAFIFMYVYDGFRVMNRSFKDNVGQPLRD